MPRLAICSRDLHWHWINRTLLCDTMEVSMLSRAWLSIAQHVFQPVLTGGPELILRKIVSGEPGTKVIAVSRFREKLSPANWVQGVTAISRKISRSWAPKKWGPTCDRDISNSAIYTTAIYRAYTVMGLITLLTQYSAVMCRHTTYGILWWLQWATYMCMDGMVGSVWHGSPVNSSWPSTVETLYNTVNFCWSTHKRHSIARPKCEVWGVFCEFKGQHIV